jgi:hypothetical protein
VIIAILSRIKYRNIAVTSIGLDGEEIDQVTFLNKPRIYALEGYIIATAAEALKGFEAKYKIIENTDIFTSIGYIKIVKVTKAGNALIAGPSIIKDMEKVIKLLEKYELKNIFIDGAFFRHSLAKVAEATILVIGASLSNDIDKVLSDAVATVSKFNVKKVENSLEKLKNFDEVCLVNEQGVIKNLCIKSVIGNTDKIFQKINEFCKYIYIPRSLTNEFVERLVEERLDYKFSIIVKSPVNIQLNLANLTNLFKLSNMVYVLKPINLKAICYNPTAPYGYQFNSLLFKDKLEESLETKVINVEEGV